MYIYLRQRKGIANLYAITIIYILHIDNVTLFFKLVGCANPENFFYFIYVNKSKFAVTVPNFNDNLCP